MMNKFPPDWFDLKNYAVCKHFGRVAWALAINTRRKLYYDFVHHYQDKIRDVEELLRNLKEASSSNHLVLEWRQPDFVFHGDGYSFTEYGWRWSIQGKNLGETMRAEWVFPRNEEDFKNQRKFGANAEYQLDSYEVGLNEKAEDYFLESCYLANFDFSDEQLIADFKCWLALKREKQFKKSGDAQKIGKELTKTIKTRLYQQRILPYMDLYLYSLFSGVNRPSYAQIADILFPPDAIEWEKDYGEIIRETIHPKAIKILESIVLPI
ncbi:DUF6387 family protein [Neisseria lisongii]|uniref:DUF6387 family protein n=1 Tax=Neisseria lisongii TaxID=2912188 RepID=A0AAW5AQ36_9NEIS|nr:DUF6387 family protein [Neisseria lisongii]MCF7530312.1 DUF6387 family protein [Neisseria lisongii]